MPLAVTHVLLTIIVVDLFRDYFMKNHKKYITLHTLFIAGVASLLPDIDIPLNWVLGWLGIQTEMLAHGGIFHTPLFGLVFLIPAALFWRQKKHKLGTIFFIVSFAVLFHIFLDWLLGGGGHTGLMLLWPFTTAGFRIGLLSRIGLNSIPAALDAVILILWLWHEEVKHKIKDFI